MKRIIFFISFCFFSLCAFSQSTEQSIEMPTKSKLYKKIKKTVKDKRDGFYRIFRNDTLKNKNYSQKFILNQIDNENDYYYIFVTEYWLVFHYYEMIPELIKRVTDNSEIGLTNTSDLIIWERIQNGDLKFYGHGGVAFDDLFKVSGRANHLLKRITGKDFGSVGIKTEEKELEEIQKKWIKWINRI